jgi:hypothetical protein
LTPHGLERDLGSLNARDVQVVEESSRRIASLRRSSGSRGGGGFAAVLDAARTPLAGRRQPGQALIGEPGGGSLSCQSALLFAPRHEPIGFDRGDPCLKLGVAELTERQQRVGAGQSLR